MADRLQTDNPANKQMHYGVQNPVGVIIPPDKLPHVVVYSPIEGNRQFRQMEHDVYVNQKKAQTLTATKFPLILKIIGGLGAVTAGIIFRKDLWKFLKRLFK